MKLISHLILGFSSLLCLTAFAADDTWTGQFSDVMSKNKNVTDDYCKAHALDTYQASADMIYKEVTAQNGVKAKNLSHQSKQVGGVYFHTGTAMFSGETEGKEWKEKVYYFGQTLVEKEGLIQGVWYTKDCKGFYKVGPSSSM